MSAARGRWIHPGSSPARWRVTKARAACGPSCNRGPRRPGLSVHLPPRREHGRAPGRGPGVAGPHKSSPSPRPRPAGAPGRFTRRPACDADARTSMVVHVVDPVSGLRDHVVDNDVDGSGWVRASWRTSRQTCLLSQHVGGAREDPPTVPRPAPLAGPARRAAAPLSSSGAPPSSRRSRRSCRAKRTTTCRAPSLRSRSDACRRCTRGTCRRTRPRCP